MDVSKESNPQKHYMKMICSAMYYLGFGDCWYEGRETRRSRLYYLWAVLSNVYMCGIFFDEIMANLRSDLNAKEQNDLVQFTLAHGSILSKIVFNYVYRKDIIIVLERLLERGKSTFVSRELDQACVKRSVILCIAVIGVSFLTLVSATADGVRVYFTEGIPIRTEVVYYPSSSASGLMVNILRFLIIFHWFFAVAIMLVIDCLCICALVIVGFKFKILQAYFESLREKVLEDTKRMSRAEVDEQYREDFTVGVVMHEDTLWCAKNVQSALGKLYSVQLIENVVLMVMCLLKLVRFERNLVFLLANFLYILCLVVITGAYMTAGGDVTHEASEVSRAIFHSGWELFGARRKSRVLVVLALQRSQVPVYMVAFGIFSLNYNNFITNSYNPLIDENTFKQYYYGVSDDDTLDSKIVQEKCNKRKRSSDGLESLFEVSSIKKKKQQSSSISKAHPDGGNVYMSANNDDILQSTHLIKIEIFDLKKINKIPQNEHWKHANYRIKYYANEINNNYESVQKLVFNIAKEISESPTSKKYHFNNN